MQIDRIRIVADPVAVNSGICHGVAAQPKATQTRANPPATRHLKTKISIPYAHHKSSRKGSAFRASPPKKDFLLMHVGLRARTGVALLSNSNNGRRLSGSLVEKAKS